MSCNSVCTKDENRFLRLRFLLILQPEISYLESDKLGFFCMCVLFNFFVTERYFGHWIRHLSLQKVNYRKQMARQHRLVVPYEL